MRVIIRFSDLKFQLQGNRGESLAPYVAYILFYKKKLFIIFYRVILLID